MNQHYCDFCGDKINQAEFSHTCRSEYHVSLSSSSLSDSKQYNQWYEVCKRCEELFDMEAPSFIQYLKNKVVPLVGAPI